VTAPVRFSIQLTRIRSAGDWSSDIRQAEELGYHAVMTADHLTACAPPLLALAAAAPQTSTLRLGTLVLNNDFRQPAVLAREVAALDLLSGGRVELGLGAGYAEAEYRRAGVCFDPAKVRIARLAESVQLVRRLLAGDRVDHDGEYYSLHGEQLEQRPVQPRVPLLVGGSGRSLLTVAARLADVVGLAGTGAGRLAEHVDRQVGWIGEAAAAAGRAPELQLLLHTVVVSSRRTEVDALLERQLPDLTPAQARQSPYVLAGSPAEIEELVHQRSQRWGITRFTVRASAMTGFAPLLDRW
jgi:probable F420-dependent oxidoreductase